MIDLIPRPSEVQESDESPELLEQALRLLIWRNFKGAVTLESLTPCGQFCVIEHSNGVRGSVPVAAVVMMEAV